MPEAMTSSREIFIRQAQLADLPQVSKLGADIFSATFGHSIPPSDLVAYLQEAYSDASLMNDFVSKDVNIIIASPAASPERVVGFSQLRRGTTEPCLAGIEKLVELQRLYVDPVFHGGGVGKRLVEEIERIARDEGFENLWLGVWEENFKAQRVYERMGFEKIGQHDFTMGGCVQVDWIMCKNLIGESNRKQGVIRM